MQFSGTPPQPWGSFLGKSNLPELIMTSSTFLTMRLPEDS